MLRNVKSYLRPTQLEDAVALAQSTARSTYIGGGAWTVAQGDPTLEVVIDLRDLHLDNVEATLETISIGAMVTLQTLIDHQDLASLADGVLAQAASLTQSRNLREQGTLGGTLIVAGPADPLTTALLVVDAEMDYADPVLHKAPFTSFVAYRERLIQTRALIAGIRVKRLPSRSGVAFESVGLSPKDKPIVCAAACVVVDEGLPVDLRLSVGGVGERPVRLYKTEHLLKGKLLDQERIAQALVPALAEIEPFEDYRGSAAYRSDMARVLSQRALLRAWERARRG